MFVLGPQIDQNRWKMEWKWMKPTDILMLLSMTVASGRFPSEGVRLRLETGVVSC